MEVDQEVPGGRIAETGLGEKVGGLPLVQTDAIGALIVEISHEQHGARGARVGRAATRRTPASVSFGTPLPVIKVMP